MIEYNSLARSYNVLENTFNIKNLLVSFFKDEKFLSFSKRELHQFINTTLLKHHSGEEVFKYILTKHFIQKKVIAAYEVNTLSSRADFVTINGDSKSFEIKTDIDSLVRIEKQAVDYSKVFEYNYVVVGEKHLNKIELLLPEYVGIWVINNRNALKKIKQASISPNLSEACQLKLLNKKELTAFFGDYDKISILKNNTNENINKLFKECLKKRYRKRWNFLKENQNEILPLNYQFFFSTNLNPKIVYDSV